MLTQIKALLARIERATSVEESATLLIRSFGDTLTGLRAQLAGRGDSTAEVDLAIANLDAKTADLAAAIKANTDAEGEAVPPHVTEPPPVIVDPNTVVESAPAVDPAPEPAPVVDPNTLSDNDGVALRQRFRQMDDTPLGEFPTLTTWLAHDYLESDYEAAKARFYADKAKDPASAVPLQEAVTGGPVGGAFGQTRDAATEPPAGEASTPVLDVAPEGQTSEQLNRSGALPSGSEPAPVEALKGG